MEVAVIGGGVAGLVAGRHVASTGSGFNLTLYEGGEQLGGTWVYDDRTHTAHQGLPTHSSLYKSLRTNLPKEAMMFPDFPHVHHTPSYLAHKQVLQYLNDYADHFAIRKYIKFQHYVKMVIPLGSKWKLTVWDIVQNKEYDQIFDVVIICNGHYSYPKYPKIEGITNFTGSQVHSHTYREPTSYRGKKILIIGAGPSGLDITTELSIVSQKVILSHHTDYATRVGLPQTVIFKPDVEKVAENGIVIFKDGTTEDVDIILYCTGYLFKFPFLSNDSGVMVEENYVSPLYKHVININRPTMGFIALVKHIPTFYVADLQVRFFLQSLKHPSGVPSKLEMLLELENEIQQKKESGIKQADYHTIGPNNLNYINELAELGEASPIPDILLKIYFHGYDRIFSDFKNFRNNYYRIIDKENFSFMDLREIQAQHVLKLPSNLNILNLVSDEK